jgi:hypothetical protein
MLLRSLLEVSELFHEVFIDVVLHQMRVWRIDSILLNDNMSLVHLGLRVGHSLDCTGLKQNLLKLSSVTFSLDVELSWSVSHLKLAVEV